MNGAFGAISIIHPLVKGQPCLSDDRRINPRKAEKAENLSISHRLRSVVSSSRSKYPRLASLEMYFISFLPC